MIKKNEQLDITPLPCDLEMGQRFRQAREFLEIPSEQLAIFLETSSDTITNVEQGKQLLPTEWVYKLSRFFGINPNWLLLGAQHITKEKSLAYTELLKLKQVPQVAGTIDYQLAMAIHIFKDEIRENEEQKNSLIGNFLRRD